MPDKLPKFLFLFVVLSFSLQVKPQQSVRVEPPFWWEGMKYNNIEILLYGDSISTLNPAIDSKNIQLKDIYRTNNPNYLFLDIQIPADAKKGFNISLKNINGEIVFTYWYGLKPRKQNSTQREGFNSSDVVYLIMPDRFANGDTTNDSQPGMYEKCNRKLSLGRHGGDLKGISDHLGYIKNMGFTTIWLTPVLENNMFTQSYHGYAITDYYKVDSRFGTNQDYKKLIEKCHTLGLKVIMDMVFNHAGTQNRLIKDLPDPDWVNQWPEFTRSNYRAEVNTDSHASEFDRNKMSKGWFDTTMADLNQTNPRVLKYLTQNSIWWVENADLDGIRMDTYPYPDKLAMSGWAKDVMTEYPNFNIVGETWLQQPSHTAYWQRNSVISGGLDSHLKSVTDFPTFFALNDALNEADGWTQGWARLYNVLSQDFLYPNPDDLLIFADNHDTERFSTKIGGDINKFRLAMAYLLTTRGIPEIYYGTEIMMESKPYIDHGSYRRDFPGGWPGDSIDIFTGTNMTDNEIEAQEYLKKLLFWRQSNDVISKGRLTQFIPQDNVYVICRSNNDNESVLVILNKNTALYTLDMKRFAECTSKYTKGTDVITGKEFRLHNTIKLEPMTPLILELK